MFERREPKFPYSDGSAAFAFGLAKNELPGAMKMNQEAAEVNETSF